MSTIFYAFQITNEQYMDWLNYISITFNDISNTKSQRLKANINIRC